MTLVVRPGILDVAPYVGGASTVEGVDRVIRLASNENPLGPSAKAIAAYQGLADELHRYPDGGSFDLRHAIAAAEGLPADQLVCGAGSDELISLLVRAYAGPGDEVLYSQHGFLMYSIAAKTTGCRAVAAPETGLRADVDALLDHVSDKTRVLFLANPNNPTGSYLTSQEITRLRQNLPDSVLLVIDAAYAEYVSDNGYESGQGLVRSSDNVVMLRTFSKIHGLAGLRIGWAFCPPDVVDVLHRLRGPFNTSNAAQAAAAAAVADKEYAAHSRNHNASCRSRFREDCRKIGLTCHPSAGNFVLLQFPEEPGRDAASAATFLKKRGILVRGMAPYGLPHCLRVTIGLEADMRETAAALADFVG